MYVAPLPEQRHHVGSEGGGGGAALPLRPAQQVARRGGPIPLCNHVQEGDEVVAHGGGQLLCQPKVQQHQLQPRHALPRLATLRALTSPLAAAAPHRAAEDVAGMLDG
jgi:hypothetical protein